VEQIWFSVFVRIDCVLAGRIVATVEIPRRKPPQTVKLRFRHPQAMPIRSVTLNGQDWREFNKDKEVILLTGVQGKATVVVNY
jgi:hypothetical protein